MSTITLSPSQLNGKVAAPPSKSDVHRAIICAALSGGVCRVAPVSLSNDIKATISCIRALGAEVSVSGDTVTVDGTNLFNSKTAVLDCSESGSTLRFFIPIAAAGGADATFIGSGRLPERPIGIYLDILPQAGVSCKSDKGLPLEISGQLRSGTFSLPGDISSQFITGLMLALPLLDGDSEIVLTTPLSSVGYIDMTLDCMRRFGVVAVRTAKGWFIKGNQRYVSTDYRTDGDWSQAAFFMAAGAVSGDVTVEGLRLNSTQGDKEVAEILRRFGADIELSENSVRVRRSKLTATEINAGDIPDLVPILAVVASFAEGKTRIYNAERLRIKESDRLRTTADMLNALGGKVTEKRDELIIEGTGKLRGGEVDGANDHRIVMSASVAALGCESKVTITDRESINKSYPDYFEEYFRLGGRG